MCGLCDGRKYIYCTKQGGIIKLSPREARNYGKFVEEVFKTKCPACQGGEL